MKSFVAVILLATLAACRPAPAGSQVAASQPATPATVATPSPGPEAARPPACLVDAAGIGPAKLGRPLDEVSGIAPGAILSRTSDGEGVALVEVVVDGDSRVVAYTGEDDPEKPVDPSRAPEFLETFSPACATPEGIHPGSTVEAAEAVYGPTERIRRSEIEARQYIEFARGPAGLQFRLDEGGEFAEGEDETVRHVPGAKILSIAVSRR
jgi:hypothetical protein